MKQLLHFHEDPKVIAWWSERFNRLLSWLTPAKRRLLLSIGAIYIGIKSNLYTPEDADKLDVPTDWLGKICVIITLFIFIWLIYRLAVSFRQLPNIIRRHPLLALHVFFWLFMASIWLMATTDHQWLYRVMVGIVTGFPFLLWRCGYLLQSGQSGSAQHTAFKDHLFYLFPFFGGSETPYGKGYDYLSRCEAKTNDQLARSQLAGIKLLLLSGAWSIADAAMYVFFYGNHSLLAAHGSGVPELAVLVKMGANAPVGSAWASIYCEFIHEVLDHASQGHRIIGILRIFGFNVFRNTYKPLLAESIVEFWNRYYYYFKEIMANFFFIPTFMQTGQLLKKWPTLRLLTAVFAAAFIGNMYYHILKRIGLLLDGHVFTAVYSYRSRFFYCFLLSVGIFVSMLRAQRRNSRSVSDRYYARGLRMFGVWTFFSLIFIWNVKIKQGGDFAIRTDFFLNLFHLL